MLLIDPEDSGTGVTVQRYAKAHGVAVVDYDRLTLGAPAGTADYVSFNNVHVGQLIGSGFVQCVNQWQVAKPNVVVMHGAVTDNNATLFAQGYNGVLASYFQSGKYMLVARTAGTWMPPVALTEFEGAYTAHHNINSAVIPNDENGAPIISYLQSPRREAEDVPDDGTGRDPDRSSEHPLRLPVRDGLQADLPGGAGGGRARDVPPRRQDRAGVAAERARPWTRRRTCRCPPRCWFPSGSRRRT